MEISIARVRHAARAAALLSLVAACGEGSVRKPPDGGGTFNDPPIASAGSDQVVPERSSVTLDASASLDPDGDTILYHWEQVSGASVALTGAGSETTTFTSPAVDGDQRTAQLTFRVTVNDQEAFASDTVIITVYDLNRAPLMQLDLPSAGVARELVVASAEASSDPDGTIVSWAWEQLSGDNALFSDPLAARTDVTLPNVTELNRVELKVTATDDEGRAASATAQIEVAPVAAGVAFVGMTDPTTFEVNETWTTLRLEVRDGLGRRITGGAPAIATVLLSVATGNGNLTGPDRITAVGGLAIFNGLAYDRIESGVHLRATLEGTTVESLSPTINVVDIK